MKKIAKIKAFTKRNVEALFLKAYMWLYGIVLNRGYKTKNLIKGLSITRLRVHFSLPLGGEDEEKDQRLYEAVNRFFDWDYEIQEKSITSGSCEFYEWLRQDNQAKDDLEKYYLLSHHLNPKENEKTEIARQYRLHFGKELIPLNERGIGKLYDDYKKWHRIEVREFLESKASRIHLDLTSVIPHLKWILLCFVIGGYIYASMLYGHFGISPSQFFSIDDYLVMSLDQILPLALAVFSYIGGVIYRYRQYSIVTKYEMVKKLKSGRMRERIIIFLCAWILVMHIWHSAPVAPELLTVAVFAVVHNPVAFLARRYFENDDHAAYIFLFIIVFGACLYFNAEQKIKEVELGQSETTFEVVTQSKTFTENNSTLIGSNSRYIFLKTSQNNVEVLRLNQVDRIAFQKESN